MLIANYYACQFANVTYSNVFNFHEYSDHEEHLTRRELAMAIK